MLAFSEATSLCSTPPGIVLPLAAVGRDTESPVWVQEFDQPGASSVEPRRGIEPLSPSGDRRTSGWTGEEAASHRARNACAIQQTCRGQASGQAYGILACDFLAVETLRLKTIYVLFFIELRTRRVHTIVASGAPAEGAYVQIQNLAGDFQAEVRADAVGSIGAASDPRALAPGVLAAGRWEGGTGGRGGRRGPGRRGRAGLGSSAGTT